VGFEPIDYRPHPVAVLGVARVVGAVLVQDAAVGRPVDVVDMAFERGEPARNESGFEALRGEREVSDDAEPAEALAQHAPALYPQLPS
jgi:hypothetical protein